MQKSTRNKIIGLILGGLILGLSMILGWRSREPYYQGRSLTSWLTQCMNAPVRNTPSAQQAAAAIRAIGAERALPHLLRMAEARDGPIRSWIIEKNEHWKMPLLRIREAKVQLWLAETGFEALGTNAAPAVPQLARLMENTYHARVALLCLTRIGTPAEASVSMALTNADAGLRRLATESLAQVTGDFFVYLDRIKGPLNDPDASIRGCAVRLLGWQKQHADEVAPLLIQALNDPDLEVARDAAVKLGEVGTHDPRAFDALKDVVEGWDPESARLALRSLVLVDPDRAAPILLRQLQSNEAGRRAEAATMLGGMDRSDQRVLTGLKAAMGDPDVVVRLYSVWALGQLRRQARKAVGNPLIIVPDEPQYGGKSLREWLQTPAGVNLTPEAKDAVRGLGTNAIPALLWMLSYRDPQYGVCDEELGRLAFAGFNALGEAGSPGLPKLLELATGKVEQVALFARSAIENMGIKDKAVSAQLAQADRERTGTGNSSTNTVPGAAAAGAQK